MSYGLDCYSFEPPQSDDAIIFVEHLKIIPWVLCDFFFVPSIPAKMLAVHFLFNLTTFFTFISNLFLIVLP